MSFSGYIYRNKRVNPPKFLLVQGMQFFIGFFGGGVCFLLVWLVGDFLWGIVGGFVHFFGFDCIKNKKGLKGLRIKTKAKKIKGDR